MTGTSASITGDIIEKETCKYSKYEYATIHKQRITYTFKPLVMPAFARALDDAVRHAIGDAPGRYTVKIDKPIRRSNDWGAMNVLLRIRQMGQESTQEILVPGWRYDAGESE